MTWWEKTLLAYLAFVALTIGWLLHAARTAPLQKDW